MFEWLMHALHAGESIEQVEFIKAPPGSAIPIDRKLTLVTATPYLQSADAAHCSLRVNTRNSKDGARVFYIQKKLCFYCSVRAWMGFIDLEHHHKTCPGAGAGDAREAHLDAVFDPDAALTDKEN